jgi:hypothetical protein
MVQQRRAGIFHFFFIGRLSIDFSRFEMRFGRLHAVMVASTSTSTLVASPPTLVVSPKNPLTYFTNKIKTSNLAVFRV